MAGRPGPVGPGDAGSVAGIYDRAGAAYDRSYDSPRLRARARIIDAPQLAATRAASAVLELGVGTGRLLAQVRAPLRVGIDVSAGMLRHGKPGLLLARADANALPFASGSFDAVLAGKGVFRYLDVPRAMAECARVLRRGGRLAVHQYARSTWTLVPGQGGPADDRHLGSPADLDAAAAAVSLERTETRLFRPIRVPPYAVRVPQWGKLWSHCVLVFARA